MIDEPNAEADEAHDIVMRQRVQDPDAKDVMILKLANDLEALVDLLESNFKTKLRAHRETIQRARELVR